ncbi:putative peptidase S13 family protein [Streptomyces sp. NBRC 110611]|uniref:D-alanyl-D-alanine carboxypeptidase/D-alanyl-D-alanine endopeptidase n=1 Tax=Streptomyces sp. NBRC 110611 TaxID=1621259 RepID=UPI0008365FB7|nr:D-alanyl-D-alanine carboxypeptidase/D-alanyl-D-alanine-endopeptidase [Streptomyces sp. NBRC 110611]GAU68842.1 putative peptidase S13 family protein [Streptomyces sp. NBRC 110611]
MPETGKWQVRWQSVHRSARTATHAAGRTARTAAASARQAWRAAPRHTRQTWRLTVVSAATGLAVALVAVAAAGPWDSGQRRAERAAAAVMDGASGEHHAADPGSGPSAPPVLPALGGRAAGAGGRGAAPAPTAAGLADALEPLLKDPALGPVRTASVIDVAAGREIFGAGQGTAVTPASTVKLATGVAALAARGPDHRIETTVVMAGADRLVLVGGGDPTLTARAPKRSGEEQPASLRALADDTARALARRHVGRISLGYDTSAYSGPVEHSIGPNENIAPVTALMVDEARLDGSEHGTAPRESDPARAAAATFAELLGERGITVDGAPAPASAPKGAGERIAVVRSLPVSSLVERMLTYSDNDIAEALARQTALAARQPASFAGAARAVRTALERLRLPLTGAVFADGSGLDRKDKVSAALLSRLLLEAAAPGRPALRPVVTGLPVAAFTGTLSRRYAGESAGAGTVRAKTGTLTGVNTLAGTVVDADGRLLAFSFMTSGTEGAEGAQEALDKLASAVANCGCR